MTAWKTRQKNRKKKMKKTILSVLLLCMTAAVAAQKQASRIEKQLSVYNQIMRELDVNFVDTLSYEQMNLAAIRAMLSYTDPYTVYYPPEKSDLLTQMTTGKYAGVGAIITSVNDTVYFSDPYVGKPAYKAGVRAGDAILSIDGEKMTGLATSEVSQKLRGKIGTELKVKVKRAGVEKPLTFSITREQIQMDPVIYSTVIDNKYGYLDFQDFTENSSSDFRDVVEKLTSSASLEGLIIDLRGNPGGLVGEAAKILSYFIDEGTTVVVNKSHGEVQRTYKTPTAPRWRDMPLVVLVDDETASAAEIVAGTLQDLDRAVIVGGRTFGKGLVQSVREIEGGGNLKITVAKYYIPSGRCIQAIDYSHRADDGKPYYMPDSLTSEYKTANGRTVRDGGGITPDVEYKDDITGGSISYRLSQDQQFFLFANKYAAEHSTIESLETFEVTDAIMKQFTDYLHSTGYQYTSFSAKYLDEMKKALKYDGLLDSCEVELGALEKKLNPSLEDALRIDDVYVRYSLALELLNRYYSHEGTYGYMVRNDKCVAKAKELLADPERMKDILSGKAAKEAAANEQ